MTSFNFSNTLEQSRKKLIENFSFNHFQFSAKSDIFFFRKSIENVETEKGDRWSDVCIQVPVVVKPPNLQKIFKFGKRRKKRELFEDFDDFEQSFQKFSETFDNHNHSETFSRQNVTKKVKLKMSKNFNLINSVNQTSEKLFSDFNFDDFESETGEVESDKLVTNIGEYFSLEFSS